MQIRYKLSLVTGIAVSILAVACVLPSSPVRAANGAAATALTPVTYTAEQAKRGKAVYSDACIACHGSDLGGFGEASPLNNDDFVAKYANKPVLELFDTIQSSMPKGNAGSLKSNEVADIISYILSVNKLTPGTAELPTDREALKTMQIVHP